MRACMFTIIASAAAVMLCSEVVGFVVTPALDTIKVQQAFMNMYNL